MKCAWVSVATAFMGVQAYNEFDRFLLREKEMTLLSEIDIALEAAEKLQIDFVLDDAEYISDFKETQILAPDEKFEDKFFMTISANQCKNGCYAYNNDQIDKCLATCYARYSPKNSNLNTTEGEPHTCGEIEVMVYDNPYCSGKPNEAASKEYADVIAADIERN